MHFFSQKIIKLFILAILLVSPILVYGISQAACLFLLIEQGSRAGAMGQAYVAQVDDGFAGWWNPGAMAFNRSNQLALMHSNWLGDVPGIDDMYIEYISWNNYNEALLGNLGFHIIFLTYGEQERVNEQGQPLGTFSSFEVAFAGTYAYQYSDNLGMGLTFKIIYSDLAPSGAPGNVQDVKGRGISFAFDFGAKQKNLGLSGLDAAVTLQNVGPDITYIDDEQHDPLPMNLRAGLSFRLIDQELNKFTLNGDMSKELTRRDPLWKRWATSWKDDNIIYGMGAEYTYYNFLSLRMGYFYDDPGSITGMSFGAGIRYEFNHKYRAKFDFAMQPAGELTDYNKTFSLGVDF